MLLLSGVFLVFLGCGGVKSVADKEIKKNATTNNVTEKEEIEHSTQPKGRSSLDSIYPKEYHDAWGREGYYKIRKGVYVYLKSHSGREYDSELTRFDFFDIEGKIIKSYDVRASNPYNKESIPTLVRDNYESYIYDSYIPKEKTRGKPEYARKHFTRSQMPSTLADKHAVVGYHLLETRNGFVVDWKFTAVCMDEKGEVLRIFKDLDIDPYEFCLSEDKKFFCVSYGGLRGENLTRLRNNGFRIYEIETGLIVYELNVDEKHTIAGPRPSSRYNTIVLSILGNDFSDDRDRDYLKISCSKREIYRRLFPYKLRNSIYNPQKDGVIIRNHITGEKAKLYYIKDFKISKF